MVDTAGMERYRSISQAYLRNAQVCLIVFALDNVSSFINAKRWSTFAREHNADLELILVGNKMDREEREVRPRQIAELAFDIQVHKYFECSALTGEGVIKLFDIEWPVTENDKPLVAQDEKKCC